MKLGGFPPKKDELPSWLCPKSNVLSSPACSLRFAGFLLRPRTDFFTFKPLLLQELRSVSPF